MTVYTIKKVDVSSSVITKVVEIMTRDWGTDCSLVDFCRLTIEIQKIGEVIEEPQIIITDVNFYPKEIVIIAYGIIAQGVIIELVKSGTTDLEMVEKQTFREVN